MRYARPVVLEQKQQLILEQQARARSLEARVVARSKIVLLASEGKPDMEIASELGISPKKAAQWRNEGVERIV
jgi:DNA-binding NarL/FixJ family response regulator